MPGIVGLITRMPREAAERHLLIMLEAIRHEPFYATGTFIDESLGVYLGWALRQGSFSDDMPVTNERGDVTLVFSGEEFPEPGLASSLKERGHSFKAEGPSYLVHVYEEDSNFPSVLNGWFQGVVVDRTRGKATLFNDRYGMRRVYYHESRDAFYFGPEAKAILAARGELRRADPQSLGELVSCGCVMENRTIFDQIHVMPPASAWVFQSGCLGGKNSYFRPQEWEQQTLLDPEAYYGEIKRVFSDRLPRYFGGSERVGVSLTGGLDSRMIMAWLKSPQKSLSCYSIGGPFRECQDVRIARRVAAACGQRHEVIGVGDDFLSRFPHYAERTVHLTDGNVSVIHSPDLYANELAKQIAPARMTGNYGGEVFRRVRAFKPVRPAPGLFAQDFAPHIQEATRTYRSLLEGHPLSFAVFRQAPWHHCGLQGLEQTQVALRSPFLDNELVKTVFRAPASALTSNDTSLRLIRDGNPRLAEIRTDRGFGATDGLWAQIIQGYQQFTVKAEYVYDYGMPHWLATADHYVAPLHLERLFLGRHKFYHFRVWYRDALSSYVREMLLDRRSLSRPYLNRDAVEAIVEGHVKGERNYTTEIHKLLTLELINRQFLDGKT